MEQTRMGHGLASGAGWRLPFAVSATARRYGALAVVTVSVGLILGHFHDQFWWPPDEGAYAHVAERLLEGEVLNRDVQDIHAGYINFANALALWLFGDSLLSLRYPLAVLGLVQAWLLFKLFAPRSTALAIVAPVAFTALAFVQFLNPTAHWYCLFLVVAIIACLHGRQPRSNAQLLLLGVLVGCVILFRQLTGVVAGIAVFAYLVLEESSERRTDERGLACALLSIAAAGLAGYLIAKASAAAMVLVGLAPVAALAVLALTVRAPNRTVARIVALLAAGAMIAAAPLLAYHAANGSLASWYRDVVGAAMALTTLSFFDQFRLDLIALLGLRQLAAGETSAHSVNGAFWAILALLPAVLGFRVVRTLLAGDARERLAPLPFIATFYAVVSVHYETPIYLVFSSGLTLAGLLWSAAGQRHGAILGGAVALALTAVGLHFHAGQSLERGIGGVIAGVRVEASACPQLKRSGLRMSAQECETYAYLIETIQRETKSDDPILAVPSNSELYFLAERRNPTRFFNSALGLAIPGAIASVTGRLAHDPPKLVLHRTDDKYNDDMTREFMAWVHKNYALAYTYRGFEIYRPRRSVD